MALILLIRHGENDYVGKRLAGRTPGVHLNARGRQQAEEVAHTLAEAPLRAVYASPLERALETAEPLAAAHGLTVNVEPGLMEVDFGRWQGKTMRQMRRMKLWPVVQNAPSQVTFPGGESFRAAQERVAACLQGLSERHAESEVIACVSHSDSIRLALAHFLGMPLDHFQRLMVNTASINGVYIRKEGWPSCVMLNWTAGFHWPKD